LKTKFRFTTAHAKIELAGIIFLLLPVLVAAIYLAYNPFVSGRVLVGLLFVYVVGVAGYVISLRVIARLKHRHPPIAQPVVHKDIRNRRYP
jgi:uncharacterized membrane protein YedE/YeeE